MRRAQKIKILNLYAGIGGNRKLWGDNFEITAVEYDPKIAAIYQGFFPNDTVIVGDAHQYLLDHYKNFDFIWSSPPCPTHSDIRRMGALSGQYEPLYPDMSLYQEIIFLDAFFKGGYCVENVKPYYKPLIPAYQRDRHLFWSSFYIPELPKEPPKHHATRKDQQSITGFDLSPFKGIDKNKILRNCVMPGVGKTILDAFLRQSPDLFVAQPSSKTPTQGDLL